MKRLTFLAVVVLAIAPHVFGQGLSPIIVQCGKKCSGEFSFSNGSVQPLSVVVEPVSFSIDPVTKKSVFRPLDGTVEVELNETSARVGPHGDHFFDYSIRCQNYPCPVTFLVSAIIGHTDEGVAVRLILPHVVYACERAKNCRAETRKAMGIVD